MKTAGILQIVMCKTIIRTWDSDTTIKNQTTNCQKFLKIAVYSNTTAKTIFRDSQNFSQN